MAISNNPALKGFKGPKGTVGKTIVIKQYEDKTVISKYPDMSKVRKTPKQIATHNRFTEAVKFAVSIINDPVKKANYPVEKGKSVYTTAIRDYLASN
jgi:hypothetical protein